MNAATIIFPNQLFRKHPAIDTSRPVYLVEEWLFFEQYSFHKQKIVLHRATMKGFESFLIKQKLAVNYVETKTAEADIRQLIPFLAKKKIEEIHFVDPIDHWLEKRIVAACKKAHIKPVKYDSPNYITTIDEANAYYSNKTNYLLNDFYIWQRKKQKLLLDASNKPEGGKWNYDADNRKKFPSSRQAPRTPLVKENALVKEARVYIEKKFHNNYGSLQSAKDSGFFPVTFAEADAWLDDFLQHRFEDFGIYEDAMVATENFLHHSVMTPMLNTGLLNASDVVSKVMAAAEKYNIPLNSLEGFLRQVIGWREFIRIVYEREGVKERTTNFWGFHRKMPESFWKGETGIAPIDIVIKKVLDTAYSHHIERLMVLANFMLLCEFDPDEVYKWFMEMYIDSYDWVMVPNVYGMTQFADGGLMATKPYISGSSYLLKMSDFKKGSWTEIWDGLFWRFMFVHRDFFGKNPRLSFLLGTLDKMPAAKREGHLRVAETFLQSLDSGEGMKQE